MIGFVAAEKREFSGLRRHLGNRRGLRLGIQWAVAGKLNGNNVVLAADGPGPALARRAAEAIGEYGELNALVSYGFCGALDPALSVNDVFVWGKSLTWPASRACQGSAPLSIDRVAGTASEKAKLRRETGAAVVEMEAAGVSAYAQDRHIPFYGVRVVTDAANEDLPMDFNHVRDTQGRFSRLKILGYGFLHPWLLPRLTDLGRRASRASIVLGDFVADCQF